MRLRHLLAYLLQAAGQGRFNHHRPQPRLGGKAKVRLAQALIPGDSDTRFFRKSARIVAIFTRLFEKGDAAAIVRINIFSELLGFQRRPGAVSVEAQRQIGNRLQQQIDHHTVAHRLIQANFDLGDLLAGHQRKPGEQLVRVAGTERRRTIIRRLRQLAAQFRQCAARSESRRRRGRQRAVFAISPGACPRQQRRPRVIQRFQAESRQGRDFPPAFALAVAQAQKQTIAGF